MPMTNALAIHCHTIRFLGDSRSRLVTLVLRLLLVTLVASQGIGQTLAAANDYPLQVAIEKTEGRDQFVAYNRGAAPVFISASLSEPINTASDRRWPLQVLVPPKQSRVLATLFAADPRSSYRFEYHYVFSIGDPSAVHDPHALYRLPFADGLAFPAAQAHGGKITTHTALNSTYAVDITMPIGTPVVAARPGTVIEVEQSYREGRFDPSLAEKANRVVILHADGTMAEYVHLSFGRVFVTPGQTVSAGHRLGESGNTGYSSEPHLHFAVVRNSALPDGRGQHISVPFLFYVGNPPETFVPHQGQRLTAHYLR
jgi:murein DD-endopeptidase MepM/ murein hydrolase activator NlpD